MDALAESLREGASSLAGDLAFSASRFSCYDTWRFRLERT
jgi:hypothetical protein